METLDIENGIILNEDCIICQDNSNSELINYEHNCGKYKIHQECLDKWFINNSTSCIICRENIINNSPTNSLTKSPTNSDEIEVSSLSPINENNNEDYFVNNNTYHQYISSEDDQNRRILCQCFMIFVIIIFITFYFFL